MSGLESYVLALNMIRARISYFLTTRASLKPLMLLLTYNNDVRKFYPKLVFKVAE